MAYLALTAMAICFGGTWVAGKVAVDALPAFTVAAVRFGLTSLVLWGATRAAASHPAPVRRADVPLIIGLGLTAVAGYNFLFLTGLTLAPATDGAILVPGIAPIATAVLAAPFLAERLRLSTLIGLGLALVGIVLVVNPEGGTTGSRLLGDLCFLAGAGLWGIYSVLSKIASRRFDPVSITLYGAVAGTIILAPLAIAEGGIGKLVAAGAPGWLAIGYLALFGTIVGFVLFQVGIRRLGASRGAAFALLVPIFGVTSSAWLLSEPVAPLTFAGGAVILVGLWIVERASA